MNLKLILTGLLSAGLLGCATSAPAPGDSTPSALAIDDTRIVQLSTTQPDELSGAITLWQGDAEIEALAQSGKHLVWATDGEIPALWFGAIGNGRLDATKIANLDHDVDGLCFAPLSETTRDLVITDGDGRVFQYWLREGESAPLMPVRQLSSNPDIERCVLSQSDIFLDDPYLGPVKTERNPETDGILRPASAADRLEQDGQAHLAHFIGNLLGIGPRALRARNHRDAGRHGGLFGAGLVAETFKRLRRRPHEDHAGGFDRAGKIGVFGQKAVTGMDRIRAH